MTTGSGPRRSVLRDLDAPYGWASVVFTAAVAAGIVLALISFAIIEEEQETRHLVYAILATAGAAVPLVIPRQAGRSWTSFVLLSATAAILWAYYFEIVAFPIMGKAG